MRVVVDANRLFSALLRDGSTRRAIYDTAAVLVAPAFLRAELTRHRALLVKRSGLDRSGFDALVAELAAQIVWIPDEAIEAHIPQAMKALGETDPADVPYLACALAVKADAIWSHDLDFDKQDLVPRIPHPGAEPR